MIIFYGVLCLYDISRLILIVISGETRDRCKTKSDERGRSNFCRQKYIYFTAAFSILLIVILLRLAFLIIFVNNTSGE